jgi:hypothetical protein
MVDTTLGPCHYSEDMSEKATMLAVLKDGTGWIPICEDHKSDAESDGYTPQEVVDLPNAMDVNGDEDEADGTDDTDTNTDTSSAEDSDSDASNSTEDSDD